MKKEGVASLIFVTMTHRLYIRAGPSTLEAGQVTTTTLLPPLHSGRRPPPDLEPGCTVRVQEKRQEKRQRGADALIRVTRVGGEVHVHEDDADSYPGDLRETLGPQPRSARYRATRRSPVRTLATTADGRARRGPHELPPSGPDECPTTGSAKFAVA